MKTLTLIALAVAVAIPGNAALIGSATLGGSSSPVSAGFARHRLGYSNTGLFCSTLDSGCTLLFDRNISAADVGTSTIFNSGNTAAFSAFTGFLTNGTNDELWSITVDGGGSQGGNGTREASRFGLSTNDFAGYNISQIQMTILQSYPIPGNNAYFASYRLDVYGDSAGAVPEPVTAALAGAGLLAIVLVKRYRRRLQTRATRAPQIRPSRMDTDLEAWAGLAG